MFHVEQPVVEPSRFPATPIKNIGHVNVGVDKARNHELAAGVDDTVGIVRVDHVVDLADGDDFGSVDGDRPILENMALFVHRCNGSASDNEINHMFCFTSNLERTVHE